jgi:hypothetical protein
MWGHQESYRKLLEVKHEGMLLQNGSRDGRGGRRNVDIVVRYVGDSEWRSDRGDWVVA